MYDTAEKDRLANNKARVFDLIKDGRWHTTVDLMMVGGARGVGRLNELKDDGWDYEKRKRTAGVWEYRLFRRPVLATQDALF